MARTGTTTLLTTGAATAAAAVLGSIATGQVRTGWYQTLTKPSFQPPPVAFPIVWTALYADIAVSSAHVLDENRRRGQEHEARSFATALAVNLVLNAGWSWMFFRAHRLRLATVTAGALALSSADLARRAARVSPRAAAGLGAYAAWCSFASVLSGAVARLNR